MHIMKNRNYHMAKSTDAVISVMVMLEPKGLLQMFDPAAEVSKSCSLFIARHCSGLS